MERKGKEGIRDAGHGKRSNTLTKDEKLTGIILGFLGNGVLLKSHGGYVCSIRLEPIFPAMYFLC